MTLNDDGTGPSPMWTEKDEILGWVMFGFFTTIIVSMWILGLIWLWSSK